MIPSTNLSDLHATLRCLLRERLSVIADVSLRESDPTAHLGELRRVSEALDQFREGHFSRLDGRLRHYLQNASYQKALDHIDGIDGL